MTEQCKSCISRRLNGGEIRCSLNINKHLKGESCGSYIEGDPIDDFQFEYEGLDIDKLNELWLEGKEV